MHFEGKEKIHGILVETVNRGIMNINLHKGFSFGGEATGTVYWGKQSTGGRLIRVRLNKAFMTHFGA